MNNFSTGRNLTYQIKNCPTKAVHKNCLSWRCHRTTGPICKVWHCFHSSSYPFKKLGIVHYCLFFKCSYSLLSKTKEKRSFAHNLRISGIIFILKFDSIHSDKINFKSLNIIKMCFQIIFNHGFYIESCSQREKWSCLSNRYSMAQNNIHGPWDIIFIISPTIISPYHICRETLGRSRGDGLSVIHMLLR